MANRVKEQEDLRHHVLESKTTLCLSLSVYIFRTLYSLFIFSFFQTFLSPCCFAFDLILYTIFIQAESVDRI